MTVGITNTESQITKVVRCGEVPRWKALFMGESRGDHPFDLAERTALFGEAAIALARKIKVDHVTRSLVDQLVRSSTSVGANYCEADDSSTRKEFRHRIGICRREARESTHWLRMLAKAEPTLKDELRPLWKEAHELHLIFSAIFRRQPPSG